jgi:hypothetical protein
MGDEKKNREIVALAQSRMVRDHMRSVSAEMSRQVARHTQLTAHCRRSGTVARY